MQLYKKVMKLGNTILLLIFLNSIAIYYLNVTSFTKDSSAKKTWFISTVQAATAPIQPHSFSQKLLPYINHYNQLITTERQKLLQIKNKGQKISHADKQFIKKISELYNIPITKSGVDQSWFAQALLQLNVIPTSLILAQAADESNWGRSRFAKQANNYFGQWCFTKNCGLVPKARPKNATYEVQKFDSIENSVGHYILNINSNKIYQQLWQIRQKLMKQGESLTTATSAIKEAKGLLHYSTRGESYVKDIQNIIKAHFTQYS